MFMCNLLKIMVGTFSPINNIYNNCVIVPLFITVNGFVYFFHFFIFSKRPQCKTQTLFAF